MRRLASTLALLLGALAPGLHAHETLPAALVIDGRSDGAFDVSWRVPATQAPGRAPRIAPRFPDDCRAQSAATVRATRDAIVSEWRLHCDGGLRTGRIEIDGLPTTLVNVLVRLNAADGRVRSAVATPRQPHVVLAAETAGPEARAYLGLGVGHILGGVDHLLFVLCLVLLVRGRARLLLTITAFTLAHSLTLVLAALDVVRVPGPPVEATIALSILFLAAELLRPARERGVVARWPWLLAFGFGLLHGLGFAGALADVGLPQDSIAPALLLFNLGVEAGQLLFVAAVLGLRVVLQPLRPVAPHWAGALPAYAIGGVSAFWLLQRLGTLAA